MDKMVGILRQDMEEHGLRNIAVHYIGSKQPAEEWARDVIRPLIGRDVAVIPASPVIGVHVGPAVGISYICNKPLEGKITGDLSSLAVAN